MISKSFVFSNGADERIELQTVVLDLMPEIVNSFS